MKRTLFSLVLVCAAVLTAMAQHNVNYSQQRKKATPNVAVDMSKSTKDIVFYEDFSDNGFDNWTIVGEGTDNWDASESNQAGGDAPEAQMYYNPIFLGTSRLVSPVINTSGYSTLTLSFLHVLDLWAGGGGFWVGVETTSDGGATWNEVWELNWTTTDDYYAFEVLGISTPDVGSESFQVCFYFEDNSDLLDWWAIDNISLGDPILYDVTPTALMGFEEFIYGGDEVAVSAEVSNYGAETVSFDVVLEIDDDGTVVFESTQSVTDLAFSEVAVVDFESWTAVEGVNYTATVTTLLSNDENPDNDQLAHQFIVFSSEYYCIPSANCSYGDGVTDFAMAGIENYGSGCSETGYGNFTFLEGSVEIGNTYTATFGTGYSSQFASIWIDFNQDLEFSATELILTDWPMGDPGVLTDVDITIPGWGLPGTTTMRIGANYGDISSPDPCATFTYGEWEDYSIEVTGSSINYNAGVASIDMAPVIGEGDVTPKATVKNYGVETISFPVTCTIDGGYTSTVDITDLAAGEEFQVEFDTWTATTGNYTMEVETNLTGDEFPDNDMMSASIAVIDLIPTKMVVGEEGTGTWCGWCVRGHVYMDSMAMKYPDTWIGIAVHNGDPMLVDEYDAGIGPLIGYAYPGGLVNRAVSCDPSNFEANFLQEMSKIAPASIYIENKTYNSSTGELTFTVTADFIATVSDYRFNAVLVENEVTGTGPDWAQSNAYSGGAAGPMAGYELLPNPVPAEDMVYEDVARAILGGFEGAEGSLPATINAGESHSYEFTATLSEDWDINHLEIVGMLIDYATGEIENATLDFLITGVTDIEESTGVTVYPNPSQGQLTISNADQSNIYIYNINGQLMMEQYNVSHVCKLDISNFKNGTYIVKIINETETTTAKVNVIK